MFYKKINKNDIVHNAIVTHTEYEFFVNSEKVYINRESEVTGDFSNKINHVNQGHISLAEININRPEDSLVAPFFVYDDLRQAHFSSSTIAELNSGDIISGRYPMSASVSRTYYDQSANVNNFKYIDALRNPIELSGEISNKNTFSNFNANDVNMISIPSIFYGSKIKKGTVKLNYYVTGALTATLEDSNKNGELIETLGPNQGQVAGIVLYDYGIMLLTGSETLHASHTSTYGNAGATPAGAPGTRPTWLSFGSGITEIKVPDANGSNHSIGSDDSYSIYFKSTSKIPTMTILAHAEKGEYNYSNNPTFVDYDTPATASFARDFYKEKVSNIKNIRKSKYDNFEEDFENTTYISQVGIYDKNQNLIAVAKLANPVKKTEVQDYLFKLRLDF